MNRRGFFATPLCLLIPSQASSPVMVTVNVTGVITQNVIDRMIAQLKDAIG